jgi:electron transfer flavoprotein-quinone oxidoreductase
MRKIYKLRLFTTTFVVKMGKYDVIVVGAGPGGCAAAKTAAEKGLKVLLLERAKSPGDKNMSGSYFFSDPAEKIFPGLADQDFVRTTFTGFRMKITANLNGDWFDIGWRKHSPDHYVIYRNESDRWLAQQAVNAGAGLRTSVTVCDVIKEGGYIKGVITTNGERIEAPITIGADGLHSVVALRSGIRSKFPREKIMVAIKYIYKLPPEVLRERFPDGYIIPILVCGEPFAWGGCPMDPNFERGLATATVYCLVSNLADYRINIHQLMQWMLSMPDTKALYKGAEFIYFNSHGLNCAESVGYPAKTYGNGIMLVGDAAGLNNPFDGYGANVAMVTGKIAAEVAEMAISKQNYSEEVLAEYQRKWKETFIGEDAQMTIDMSKFINENLPTITRIIGDVISAADDKFTSKSYPAILNKQVTKVLVPMIPILLRAQPILTPVLKPYVDLILSLMGGAK